MTQTGLSSAWCQAQLHTWPASEPWQTLVLALVRWELALGREGKGWSWSSVQPGCSVALLAGTPTHWPRAGGHGLGHCCCLQVVVQLSEDLLSQAVMMVENSRPTLAINLTGARQHWLEGMLRHEIGQGVGRWVGR